MVALAAPVSAGVIDFTPHDFNVYLSHGSSITNNHGRSDFTTIHFEVVGTERHLTRWVRRWLPDIKTGLDINYSDIVQPRSWFGHQFGDPDDRVRAEAAYLFIRNEWRLGGVSTFADLGSGPMWSNRRIPAATAKGNFNSQLSLGATLFENTRHPIMLGYRFSHISNGGFGASRNPGLNVHGFFVGARVRKWR